MSPWDTGRVQDERSRGPQFNSWCWKEISHSSNHQNITTMCPIAPQYEYLKLTEVKTRSHCGTVVECRKRDPGAPSSIPNEAKGNSPRSIQNNTSTNHSAKEYEYLTLSRLKTRSNCGTVVECRARDPDVPSWKLGGSKRISHRSKQNNTTRVARGKYLSFTEVKIRSNRGQS